MNNPRTHAFLRLAQQRIVSLCSTRSSQYHHASLTARSLQKHHPARIPNVVVLSKVQARFASYEQQARELNQKQVDQELDDYDTHIAAEVKEKQVRAPWHREGAQEAPVHRQREASAMTKGKLNTFHLGLEQRLMYNRKTADYSFAPPQTCPSSEYSRHQ